LGLTAGAEVIPKPRGDITVQGNITTTSEFQDVCSRTITKDKVFKLAKITVSCPEDCVVRLTVDNTPLSIEYTIMGKLPFTDWFPPGWKAHELKGDGSKKIKIQAKYVDTAATLHAEFCGEEG